MGETHSTSLQWARDYVRRGWRPIPIPFKSKNPGYKGWEKTNLSESDLPSHFNGMPKNVGVLLGSPSNGLIDVDLDCPQSVALAGVILPPTGSVFGRPGNPRSHRLYVCNPVPETAKFHDVRKDAAGKTVMLVELRSTGAQTVFPGSTHEKGEAITFEVDDQPADVEGDYLAALVSKLAAGALLARHWPGKGSRHDTAMALAGGLVRCGWAMEDVVEFVGAVARTAGDEEVDDRTRAAADSFNTISVGGNATGWPKLAELLEHGRPVVEKVREWIGAAESAESKEAAALALIHQPQGTRALTVIEIPSEPMPAIAAAKPEVLKPFPRNLLKPSGFVGELCEWINGTAIKPQPILTLGNVLAFWGAIVGRKVRTPTNLRTNVYCLGVNHSGRGKDHSMKRIIALLNAARMLDYLGGRPKSASAIISAVRAQNSILYQWDEVGHFYRNALNLYTQSHQKEIPPTLTMLFSEAGSVHVGDDYADRKSNKREPIPEPNVCVYGTTVPELLYEGLTPSELQDGFLARNLVFQTDDNPEERSAPISPPPQEFVDHVRNWHERTDLPKTHPGNLSPTEPFPVEFDDEAEALLRTFKVRIRQHITNCGLGRGVDVLWTRAAEHAAKIALIVASGVSFTEFKVTHSIMVYAIELVEHLVGQLVETVEDNVSGTQFGRDTLRVYRVIKALGQCTQTVLSRRTQGMKPKDRDQCILELQNSGSIVARIEKQASGKTAHVYYPVSADERRVIT